MMKKIFSFAALSIAFSLQTASAQNPAPVLGQATATIKNNGLPIGSNIRILDATIDITTLLDESNRSYESLTVGDFQASAVRFLIADNLKKTAKQTGAAGDISLLLVNAFNKAFYTDKGLQSFRVIYPYQLKVTGMFQVGDRSFINVSAQFANANTNNFLSREWKNGGNLLLPGSEINQRVNEGVTSTSASYITYGSVSPGKYDVHYSVTEREIQKFEKSQNFQFDCGYEKGNFSLNFSLEHFTAYSLEQGFKTQRHVRYRYQNDPEEPYRYFNHSLDNLTFAAYREQTELGMDMGFRLVNFNSGNLCLKLGATLVHTEARYTTELPEHAGMNGSDGGTIYSPPAHNEDMIDRISLPNTSKDLVVARVGLSFELNQPNRKYQAKRPKYAEWEYNEPKLNRLTAIQQLQKASDEANKIMDTALEEAECAQNFESGRKILLSAQKRVLDLIYISDEVDQLLGADCTVREVIGKTKERAINLVE
jgi:hypothetical protein